MAAPAKWSRGPRPPGFSPIAGAVVEARILRTMNGFGRLLLQSHGESAPPAQNMDVVALTLILLLLGIGGIGLFFVWLARQHTERVRAEISASLAVERASARRYNIAVSLFGFPSRWLAIRSSNTPLIQEALRLRHVQSCTWEDSLATTRDQRLFVTPPIDGWTLVYGAGLPEARADVDTFYRFFLALSHKLGHVQYFTTDRVLSHHGWARAEGGKIVRAYIWAGETLWNEGPQTEAERELAMTCLGYAEPFPAPALGGVEPAIRNLEKVARLAAEWSVNLADIREPRIFNAPGIVGVPAAWKRY